MNKVVQEPFLDLLVEKKTQISVYLVSGMRLQGTLEGYDAYVLFVSCPTGVQSVYKGVISTIAVQHSQPRQAFT
ncbi:RNA chaperone Hfq [Piscirickettsia litoralis]|uniref:Sm domain-containing protein n=1 Tax=Piscirickettsia litoralis TaxID=1891921 RepID=A0ABX3A3F9_9GAMM|nr:RNA chaperone Hfq [Piscirickettsia litoralis]ODN42171.1 hypothetical protein BGC07_03445 [Piscirickettsia litoralis]